MCGPCCPGKPNTKHLTIGGQEIGIVGFDEIMAKGLEHLDDTGWNRPVRFFMNGKQINETSTHEMLWGFLHDMIHHRGQLSTYVRAMGGKVPSIYGPSADAPPAG